MSRIALVLLLACSEREPPAPTPPPPDRTAAWARVTRQRVRSLVMARALDRRALDAQLDALANDLRTARAAVADAKTARARVVAQGHADALSRDYDALLAHARARAEAALAESARIELLPDRCFTEPVADDCRLDPALLRE